MDFKVIFFTDNRGKSFVEDYIHNLNEKQQNKIMAYIKLLEEEGYQLKRPIADSLGGKTGLYELRPGKHRILYYFQDRKYIVLLHAFLKNTDEILENDIELALFRKEIAEVQFKYGQVEFEDDNKEE